MCVDHGPDLEEEPPRPGVPVPDVSLGGDKKGVTWHVISTHREVEEAPYFCRVCPARFVTARVWRKHTSQASHRAKLILRPEQAATALGQGGPSVRFEGPESEAVQMDRGYSEKYWMLVSQASATKPLETDDEDDDEAPSLTPSNRSTPSPAKLEQRPDRGELSYKAEERPVSAAKVSDKSAPKTEKTEKSGYAAKVSGKATPKVEKPGKSVSAAKLSGGSTSKAEKSEMSVAKISGKSTHKAEKPEKSVAMVSDKSTPKAEKSEMSVAKVSDKATPKAEKSEMSVAKVSDKATPKAEKSRMSVTKVSDKATPKAEKSGMSVTKVSDKATPKAEKPEKSVAKVSDKSAPRPEKKSSDRDAAHSSHKSEKQDVSTSRHGSPSPADDVIVLAPSDEETDPGLQSDWQEELDYGEDQDWEPGRCPQDTKTMGGLRGTGPTVPDGSSDKENWAESSPLSSRTGPTLLPVPVEPTPSTSREPTLPTRQEPDPLTGMTTSHPLFAVGPDWPQQLGKAAGEAFAEGLRVALKPLEEESKRQTAALEQLAKDEKKTAEALQAVLKALSNKEHRRDEGGKTKRSRSRSRSRSRQGKRSRRH